VFVQQRIKPRTEKDFSRVIVSIFLVFVGVALACVEPGFASAQVRQIDRAKLPQIPAVQNTYTDLLPIDRYARSYEAIWRYPIPKNEVAARFSQALQTLVRAQNQAPENKELQLFAGLVAHLAYNVGVEEAYDAALELLPPPNKEDYRTSWFFGMHQCQAVDPVVGMRQLLEVEASNPALPGVFWEDYATCATVTSMPVHAIRAYDNRKKSTDAAPNDQAPAIDDQMEQAARKRSKPGDPTVSYPAKLVWSSEVANPGIRYTSNVCGVSFTIRQNSHVTISDVSKGTCAFSIDTEPYPSRYGPSSGSILLLTQAARPNESFEVFTQRILEAFSKGLVKDPANASPTVVTGAECPVASCLAYEIVTNKQYQSEGGAHLVGVFFQSEEPAYPGLRLETPQRRPSAQAFFRPEDVPRRFPGTLFHFVALDANQDIYPRSRTDFDLLMKSLIVDSK
jgi:hypothetical protein